MKESGQYIDLMEAPIRRRARTWKRRIAETGHSTVMGMPDHLREFCCSPISISSYKQISDILAIPLGTLVPAARSVAHFADRWRAIEANKSVPQ